MNNKRKIKKNYIEMNNINLPTGPHNGGNRAFPQI
jgi:hypothetical protein